MLATMVLLVTFEISALGDVPRRVSLTEAPKHTQLLLAQASLDVIETTDGQVHVGRVLDENKAGYLFRSQAGSSLLIEYGKVKSIQRASAQQAPPPPQVPTGAPSAAAANSARLDQVEAELAQARIDLDKYPTGGAVFSIILGSIFLAGLVPVAAIITSSYLYDLNRTGYDSGALGPAVMFWLGAGLSLATLVLGIVIAAINGGPRRKLVLRIETLEETRERLIRTSGGLPPPPSGLIAPDAGRSLALAF